MHNMGYIKQLWGKNIVFLPHLTLLHGGKKNKGVDTPGGIYGVIALLFIVETP